MAAPKPKPLGKLLDEAQRAETEALAKRDRLRKQVAELQDKLTVAEEELRAAAAAAVAARAEAAQQLTNAPTALSE
eukprot:6168036-Amphidinium_carterae.1